MILSRVKVTKKGSILFWLSTVSVDNLSQSQCVTRSQRKKEVSLWARTRPSFVRDVFKER